MNSYTEKKRSDNKLQHTQKAVYYKKLMFKVESEADLIQSLQPVQYCKLSLITILYNTKVMSSRVCSKKNQIKFIDSFHSFYLVITVDIRTYTYVRG